MIPAKVVNRLRPDRYLEFWLQRPRRALRAHVAVLRHPLLVPRLYFRVPGLVSPFTLALLWDSVVDSRSRSPNIVEVGAYKGLSTCCLSKAAARCNKRVWTFEWFEGLPPVQSGLDSWVRAGSCKSDEATWRENVERHGVISLCRLVVGDARRTIVESAVLTEEGFCVAFVDVDTYDVSRAVLEGLSRVIQGGETILVHDSYSPGVQKAIAEFVSAAGRPVHAIDYDNEVVRVTVD